jgi:hypothetical protein
MKRRTRPDHRKLRALANAQALDMLAAAVAEGVRGPREARRLAERAAGASPRPDGHHPTSEDRQRDTARFDAPKGKERV